MVLSFLILLTALCHKADGLACEGIVWN